MYAFSDCNAASRELRSAVTRSTSRLRKLFSRSLDWSVFCALSFSFFTAMSCALLRDTSASRASAVGDVMRPVTMDGSSPSESSETSNPRWGTSGPAIS